MAYIKKDDLQVCYAKNKGFKNFKAGEDLNLL